MSTVTTPSDRGPSDSEKGPSPEPARAPALRRWGIRAFAAAWALVAAEVFLRVVAPVPMLPRYIEAGSMGVRVNMPDRTYRHRTPDYVVELRTNEQGIRADRAFAIPKPPGLRRIVLLGDSFGMGYGVNLEDASITLLEERLTAHFDAPVEVVNLSVSGHGTAEELVLLDEAGLAYEPDLVVVYFHVTDFQDNPRSNLYVLDDDGALVRAAPSYLPAVRTREILFSFAPYRWLAGESHLFNLMRDFAARQAKSGLLVVRRAKSSLEELLAPTREELPIAPAATRADRSADGPSADARLAIALLDGIRRSARSIGGDLLVLSIPVRESRNEFSEAFPFDADALLAEPIDVVSPIERFRDADGALLYWERSHGHWTPLGCELVADTLFEAIVNGGLLDTPATRPEPAR